jgi:WD40 repeat protein
MNRSYLIRITVSVFLFTLFSFAFVSAQPKWRVRFNVSLPAKGTCIAYSLDGTLIAIGHSDGRVSVWNSQSGKQVALLSAHEGSVRSVFFFPQDDRLISIGEDKRGRLWSTKDWSAAGLIEGMAFSGGVSPDGCILAAQDAKQAIWLWDLATLKRTKQLSKEGIGGTSNMNFTSDGRYLVAAYSSPWVFDIQKEQPVPLVSSEDRKKTALKIEKMEGNQASISLGPLQDDDAPTHRVIPSRIGLLLALARGWYGKPPFIDLWDISAMKRLDRIKVKDAGTLTSFSFDNSLLAVEGAANVTLVRISDKKQVAELKGSGIMQFSTKSMEIAVTDNTSLLVYEVVK